MRNRFLCLIPTTANLHLRMMKFKLFNCVRERERERASKRELLWLQIRNEESRRPTADKSLKSLVHPHSAKRGWFPLLISLKDFTVHQESLCFNTRVSFVLNCVCRTSVWTTVWVHHSGPHTQSHHVLFSEYTPVNTNISIIIHNVCRWLKCLNKNLTSKPHLKKVSGELGGQKEPSDSKLVPAADGISAGSKPPLDGGALLSLHALLFAF